MPPTLNWSGGEMVSDTVGGPTLHAVRKPATNVVLPARARRFTAEPTFRIENTNRRVAASRGQGEAGRVLFQSRKKPGRRLIDIRDGRKLLRMSTILLFVGSVGWCWPVLTELRSLILVSPAAASIYRHVSYCQRFNRCRGKTDSEIGKLDPFSSSTYAPSPDPHGMGRSGTRLGRESRARIVARDRSRLQTRILERGHARPNTRGERTEAASPVSHRSKVRHRPWRPTPRTSRPTPAH